MKPQKVTIDTLEYANILKEGGVPDKQAEAHARALVVVMTDNLATKYDIELVKHDLDIMKHEIFAKMDSIDNKHNLNYVTLNNKIDTVASNLRSELRDMGKDLTWATGRMIVGAVLALSTVMGILHFVVH